MTEKAVYDDDSSLAEGIELSLAEAVSKFPILYDKTHKCRFPSMYPDKHDQVWNKISDEVNLEVPSCKSLWSCMKQKFIKRRKKLDKGEVVAAWPPYDELSKWLDQHVKKRRTRYDLMKQMKSNQKTKSDAVIEYNEDDDIDGADEEWTDLMEDKDTMVKIQVKRKDRQSEANVNGQSKKKFKIEVVNEQDAEMVTEIAELETVHKDDSLPGCDKISSTAGQIEVIELKEAQIECRGSSSLHRLDASLDTNLIKLEQIVLKCVHVAERSLTENAHSDSNDNFGKYIASLVRELPLDKRVRAQFNILQYATELIGRETKA